MSSIGLPQAVLWTDDQPGRLERDREEVEAFAPDLAYVEPSQSMPHGGWRGNLPVWPFDRKTPDGLDALLARTGLEMVLVYSAAHPVIAPDIWPVAPEPTAMECTQAAWHVAPQGSLCLLQSQGQWQPEASITELLLKAAGWHIEYALMKLGAIDRMTTNGIVNDPSLDDLISTGGLFPGHATVRRNP
jgi:hypothetical protein